jgi:hypothetical protein
LRASLESSLRAAGRRSSEDLALLADPVLSTGGFPFDSLYRWTCDWLSFRAELFGVCPRGGAQARVPARWMDGLAQVVAVSSVGRLRPRSGAGVRQKVVGCVGPRGLSPKALF